MKVTADNVESIRRNAEAALTNEQITRRRVEAIEGLLSRSFWGRVKWLFLGK